MYIVTMVMFLHRLSCYGGYWWHLAGINQTLATVRFVRLCLCYLSMVTPPQGLNRLAAIALLFLEEEMAFWCLVMIVTYFMPDGYYGRQLVASQADQVIQ